MLAFVGAYLTLRIILILFWCITIGYTLVDCSWWFFFFFTVERVDENSVHDYLTACALLFAVNSQCFPATEEHCNLPKNWNLLYMYQVCKTIHDIFRWFWLKMLYADLCSMESGEQNFACSKTATTVTKHRKSNVLGNRTPVKLKTPLSPRPVDLHFSWFQVQSHHML